MKTTEINFSFSNEPTFSEVLAHLENLDKKGYTVVPRDLNAPIVKAIERAGEALGMWICGGAIDFKTNTRVLYLERGYCIKRNAKQ